MTYKQKKCNSVPLKLDLKYFYTLSCFNKVKIFISLPSSRFKKIGV